MRLDAFFLALAMLLALVMSLPTTDITVNSLNTTTLGNSTTGIDNIAQGPHGRCSFHAVQHQWCEYGQIRTKIQIPAILNNDRNVIVKPVPNTKKDDGPWKDLTKDWKDNTWFLALPGGFWNLWLGLLQKPERIMFQYDMCKWDTATPRKPQDSCGDCKVGGWTYTGKMDCRYHWTESNRVSGVR
jgi:hypothetical protein